MWTVNSWYVSGVMTGYRVIRFGPRGQKDIDSGFSGNIYVPGSFKKAEKEAEARCAELNAAYDEPNVTPLF